MRRCNRARATRAAQSCCGTTWPKFSAFESLAYESAELDRPLKKSRYTIPSSHNGDLEAARAQVQQVSGVDGLFRRGGAAELSLRAVIFFNLSRGR